MPILSLLAGAAGVYALTMAGGGATEAAAVAPHPRMYLCRRAAAPPVMDGRLDDACWRAAAWTQDFVDIEGSRKPKPAYRTRAKMTWDEEHFYIAAEMEEPQVWATLTGHDSVIFRDNDFEVFVDPDGDNHNYFEFEINALNTGWDLFLNRPYQAGGKADNGWEIPGLKTAVHVDGTLNDARDRDGGWSVELAFPWRAFSRSLGVRLPPGAGERWRVNFSRVEWQIRISGDRVEKVPGKPEDNWVWSPQGVVNMHRPETWGYVQFGGAGDGEPKEDPQWAVKAKLHAVYDAQRGARRRTGSYAKTLAELGMEQPGLALAGEGDGYVLSLPPCQLDHTALLRCGGRGKR